MSMTAVPISMRLVFAPTAASSGKRRAELAGEMMDLKIGSVRAQLLGGNGQLDRLRSVSAAERVCDCDEGRQCPNERKPIFFMRAIY